jgi:probable rRNA maturation factor
MNEIAVFTNPVNRARVSALKKRLKKSPSIKKLSQKILRILKIDKNYIEIYVIDAKTINKIKRKFLHSNKPATVLSFENLDFPYPQTDKKPLGEIYLNQNIFNKTDWPKFLIHGVLHLIGYDHRKKNDILKMENLEKKLWEKIS